ncbi:MAG: hypothetical protein Q7J54_03620 [Candidatus Woesearchaeota archaeon]|nr:hypothetical protein [Candidatus Woesearchaeota archaeon]
MASLTLSVSDEFKSQLKALQWVNWSEIAREEAMKKLILENYMKTGKVTDEEWEFCEKIDWHPVDELPLKEEHMRKLERIRQEKSIKVKSVSHIFKNIK